VIRSLLNLSALQLLYYGDLPVEAEATKDNDPDETWPSKGEVIFDGVKLKYRPELPPVLKGISCRISPGEKVRPSSYLTRADLLMIRSAIDRYSRQDRSVNLSLGKDLV
jgi:hypothetical protein